MEMQVTEAQEPVENNEASSRQPLAARLLRVLGGGVLVASLGIFLFQGWNDASDLGRFGLLFAQTLMLMAAGLASGRYLHEPKGARVFVGIGLVAVVANFAVLGGILWSQYPLGTVAATVGQGTAGLAGASAWVLASTAGAALLLATATTLAWAVARFATTRMLTAASLRRWLEAASGAGALAVGGLWAQYTATLVDWSLPACLPVLGLVGGGLLIEQSLRAEVARQAYRLAGVTTAAVSVAVTVIMVDAKAAAALALLVGIAAAVYAFTERHAWLLAPAAIASLAGLADLVARAAGAIDIGAWGWLALAGTATVIAGSLVERFTPARIAAVWHRQASHT